MLVLQSTHDKLIHKLKKAEQDLLDEKCAHVAKTHIYIQLVAENNRLRDENTRLRRMLDHESRRFNSLTQSQSSAFTDAELKQLIALCHPDKHGGSKAANEITAKLIRMRKK